MSADTLRCERPAPPCHPPETSVCDPVRMSYEIARVHEATPALTAFLADHHADMAGTAPPESQHALSLQRLLAPEVRLFALIVDGRPLATGALAPVGSGHDELKSMRTDPDRRGEGLGARMLAFLIQDAAARGIRRLSLETGSDEFFRSAHRLYARAGFVDCAPFGSYLSDPNSLFMTLAVPPAHSSTGREGARRRSR